MDVSDNTLSLSVNALVGFSAKEGDLHPNEVSGPNHLEGIRGHQKLQKQKNADWVAEYSVKQSIVWQDFTTVLKGRIDLLNPTTTPPVIEEIKTTYYHPDDIAPCKKQLHWAQAKVYAYLYYLQALQDEQTVEAETVLCVRVTWFNLIKNRPVSQDQRLSVQALKDYTLTLLTRYLTWYSRIQQRRQRLSVQAQQADFPFGQYRPGQYHFAKEAYRTIRDKQALLVEAPTGIGKTISALFPAVKSLGEKLITQIVYLTAKGSIQEGVKASVALFQKNEVAIDYLIIQAKDKTCPCRSNDAEQRANCIEAGGKCQRTLGFYDRLPEARVACFEANDLTPDTLRAIADEHTLCPFELSLHMLPWSTLVVCDFNYAFDPMIQLSHFKEGRVKRALLVDEIHNLPDRGRDMYSAELSLSDTQALVKHLGKHNPVLLKAVKKLARFLKNLSPQDFPSQSLPAATLSTVENLILAYHQAGEALNASDLFDEINEVFTQWIQHLYRFYVVAQLYSEAHVCLLPQGKHLKLQCLDAAQYLTEKYTSAQAVVGFSATLQPMSFYQRLLGLEHNSRLLALPAVFPPQHQLTLRCDYIDTRWQARESSVAPIVALVHSLTQHKAGKYIVFFPSYEYLNRVYDAFVLAHPTTHTVQQTSNSSVQERKAFLDTFFDEQPTALGFAILGGIFGEAVDYAGDALHGAVVIGSGMGQPTTERKLMQALFERQGLNGFQFTYQFPGFSRVQQTAGRVIRSERDKGVVILVDPRFQRFDYQQLMPPHWQVLGCPTQQCVDTQLALFWH